MVKSNVKVVVRTRPTAQFPGDSIKFENNQKTINITYKNRKKASDFVSNQKDSWKFVVDHILHDVSQEEVYNFCAHDALTSFMEGYNGTIMCYGQTGAGKTFTTTGATESYRHRGLIPRVIHELFKRTLDKPEYAYTIRISYLEIYNESMYDLLSSFGEDEDSGVALQVVEDSRGSTVVKGLSAPIAQNEEEALNFLFEGETNRSIGSHILNKQSSRSHCVFTVHLERRSRVESEEKIVCSKLHLVDLAGSERVSKTHSEGTILKEAMYINKSLTFLEQVVLALSEKNREHIPYRQTKLTNVLKDSLGGNCKTLLIANVWPELSHMEETISTLRFATRMMRVSTEATVNVEYDPELLIKRYEREIKDLKKELAMHDSLANRSHVEYDPYTDEQRHLLQEELKAFLRTGQMQIEVDSMRKMKELMMLFYTLYRNCESETERRVRAEVGGGGKSVAAGGSGVRAKSTTSQAEKEEGSVVVDVENQGVGEASTTGFAIGYAGPQTTKKGVSGQVQVLTKPKKGLTASRRAEAAAEPQATATPQGLTPASASVRMSPEVGLDAGGPEPQSLATAPTAEMLDEAYATFKGGEGAELSALFADNKATLKQKKGEAKGLLRDINTTKSEIDRLRSLLDLKAAQRPAPTSPSAEDAVIIDEEEFLLLNSLKAAKKKYRGKSDQLNGLRSEIAYLTRLVEQCGLKLVEHFAAWFQGHFAYELPLDALSPEALQKASRPADVLDEEERFEELGHTGHHQALNEDAAMFYAASKTHKRKGRTQRPANATADYLK